MTAITCPNCGHHIFNLSDSPGQSAGATSSPPAAVPSSAPAGTTPTCKHGAMFFKSGTNKSGKPYSGYFCSEDDCKPVWV